VPAANSTGSYNYDSATGNLLTNYAGTTAVTGSFVVGETVRLDPTSGNLSHGATTPSTTYSYDSVTGLAVIDYTNLTVVSPNGYAVNDTIELDPTTGNINALANTIYTITAVTANTFTVAIPGTFVTGTGNITINDTRNATITKLWCSTPTYSYNGTTGDTVVTYSAIPGITPSVFTVGSTVELDPSSGNLSPLFGNTFTITAATATTFTVNFGTGVYATTTGSMNVSSSVIPLAATNMFVVNIGSGKYANLSSGNMNVDVANKTLKEWSSNGNERYARVQMVGGTRYDIQLDMYENTGAARAILSWYSPSQSKEVIPSNRLYPSTGPISPPVHVEDTYATGLIGGPFSQAILGSNGATVTLSGAPAWLTYGNGVLSGTPPVGATGDYQILITLTNAAGSSKSLLNLHIDQTGGTISRDVWTGIAGTSVATIPTTTTPNTTTLLSTVVGPTDFGDNYGARIRGYITAPTTGNYYFWLAASDTAELWISNDAESVNTFKRAAVTAGSTTPQTWNTNAAQKSGWLALEQGQQYYIEILHKAGAGSGDNVALGWSKPGEPTTAPSEVVPGYVLSPYVAPTVGSTPGTLYVATMLSQSGAVTTGVGNSTLRISEDENFGYMTRSYAGLTGSITSEHIHTDPYLAKPSTIVFDIDTPATVGDGMITNPLDPHYTGTNPQTATYKWTILPVGTLTKADIIEIIKQGKGYINLHTAAYPNGEIRGNFTLANGSRTFTPPPAPPAWTDDSNTNNGAARFLTQASFGANVADIAALKALTATGADAPAGIPASRYNTWIDNQ
ncbi:MAG: PA14 domain-containing protein, partial [Verrucomicrobia bacterium]|nr:PA14 domain-containing protein [Verrucomicrobiota bacterium]